MNCPRCGMMCVELGRYRSANGTMHVMYLCPSCGYTFTI